MDFLSDYDYHLPEELIAQEPLAERSASRLLHLNRTTGEIVHRQFTDVLDLLREGDLLVMNDTRVTAVRLTGQKTTGAEVEALLLQEVEPYCYKAMVKPAKRLHIGAQIEFGEGLVATVDDEFEDGQRILRFEPIPDFHDKLQEVGAVPLPPYIHHKLLDPERYQTVVAQKPGSAAAPTAGLHFTDQILNDLRSKGVLTTTVTLNVGIDTFRPVSSENLDEHRMHGERCEISENSSELINHCTGRIVAVGTTSVRTLESFAKSSKQVATGSKVSTLFIRPGFEFKIVDGMFTNFHLPKTTMLMMMSALAGSAPIKEAYAEAIAKKYRFLSFGDSMLVM